MLATLKETLVKDRGFARYELGFMLYGLGFMAVITAKPIFATDALQLSNTVMLGARALFCAVIILTTAFMGRFMDRVGPARLACFSYAVLASYMLLLTLCQGPITYILSEIVFAAAMSGVLIAWNMGPVTFAPDGDAMRYMGIHVAFVGVRACVGHPIGGILVEWGPRYVFLLGAVLLVAATLVMGLLASDLKNKKISVLANDLEGVGS